MTQLVLRPRSNAGERKAPRVTSYDVARLAGVSQSSVSRSFDPDGTVTDDLREKVKAAARRLNWRPNSIASSLQRRSTDFIGVITYELSSPWRAQQLAALLPALERSGHRPLIFQTTHEADIDNLIDEVLTYQGRAIIVGAGLISSRLARICAQQGLLVVLLNRWVTAPGVVPISCDHRGGARLAVDHLAERGCRRVAFLHGNPNSYAGHERCEGFLEQTRRRGLEAEVVPLGSFERDAGRRAGALIAARSPRRRPHGVLAGNDALALGVLDHAYATGAYSVPRDFALIGFDDIAEGAAPAYQLTTIHQPLAELTASVVALLENWKNENARPTLSAGQILAPHLVERRSTQWRSA